MMRTVYFSKLNLIYLVKPHKWNDCPRYKRGLAKAVVVTKYGQQHLYYFKILG